MRNESATDGGTVDVVVAGTVVDVTVDVVAGVAGVGAVEDVLEEALPHAAVRSVRMARKLVVRMAPAYSPGFEIPLFSQS